MMRRRPFSGRHQPAALRGHLTLLRGITWAFVVPGLGMLAGAVFAAAIEISFRASAVQAEGVVLHMVETRSGGGRVSWVPVVAVRLPGGERTEMHVSTGTDANCCEAGDSVTILYDPADPSGARLGGFMASWLLPTMVGGAGLVFTLAGLLAGRMVRGFVRRLATPVEGELELVIEARVAGLRQEATPRGPGWVVVARAVDPRTATERLFESAPLPFDPTQQMMGVRRVEVALDPASPSGAYSMDLSFLQHPGA